MLKTPHTCPQYVKVIRVHRGIQQYFLRCTCTVSQVCHKYRAGSGMVATADADDDGAAKGSWIGDTEREYSYAGW